MKWNPHIAFNGQCKEAFEFYEKHLGGKVVDMIAYVDTPAKEHMPANTGGRIMHARASATAGDSCIENPVIPSLNTADSPGCSARYSNAGSPNTSSNAVRPVRTASSSLPHGRQLQSAPQ